jgi:hypothetical protein
MTNVFFAILVLSPGRLLQPLPSGSAAAILAAIAASGLPWALLTLPLG